MRFLVTGMFLSRDTLPTDVNGYMENFPVLELPINFKYSIQA